MSVTKLVGSNYEKRSHLSVSSISASVPAYGLKILHLSCRTTNVPVAAINDKHFLNLSERISWPCFLNIKCSLISWSHVGLLAPIASQVCVCITRGGEHESTCGRSASRLTGKFLLRVAEYVWAPCAFWSTRWKKHESKVLVLQDCNENKLLFAFRLYKPVFLTDFSNSL